MSGGFDPKAYLAEDDSAGSGFDPEAYLAEDQGPKAPSSFSDYGRAALGAVQSGLAKIDSYTGAPVRAAMYAAENSPTELGRPVAAYQAFKNQFGQNPATAPTGLDIVNAGGYLAPNSVPAKIAGFGTDMVSSPMTYLPVGELVGGAVKGVGGALGLGADAAAPGVDAVVPAGASPVRVAANAPGMASRVGGKVAETMTGVNDKLASNYLTNTDRINQIIGDYTGADGYQEADHAADIRNKWNSVLQDARSKLNGQVSETLAKTPKNASIPLRPIIDKLEDAKTSLNPSLDADRAAISQINGLQHEVAQSALPGQNEFATNPQTLQRLKQIFQLKAQPAYMPDGQIFNPSPAFAKAAKGGAAAMREAISNAVPDVAGVNGKLSDLHDIEDSMSSNLLKPDAAVHALNRAGTNAGGIEARSLKRLSDLTGYNFEQDAKDFATARQFSDPKFTPDWNGKSVLRAGMGAVAGTIASHVIPVPTEYAALGGAALTSPGALKAGVNALNIAGKTAMLPMAAARLGVNAIGTPAGQAALDLGSKAVLARAGVGNGAPINRSPAKGPEAWVQQGLSKLGIQDQNLVSRVLADPKGKELLIQASDLTPGSKAMKTIFSQIQSKWGNQP
jgi:hypothetical protein